MGKSVGGVRGGSAVERKILGVISDIQNHGYSRQQPFSIGRTEGRMQKYAEKNGIDVGSELYMSSSQIAHALRDSKDAKGLTVEPSDLVKFAKSHSKIDLYYDKSAKTFLYTDGKNKYIVHPKKTVKVNRRGKTVANFITAQKLHSNERFSNNSRFDKIN